MAMETKDADLAKAKAFFDRADEVALTGNFDYAIDMYIEGLKMAPDALEEGHKALMKHAIARQAKGGKKPSMVEKLRHQQGKTAVDTMLNAEYLWAKDPTCPAMMADMLKAAVDAGCKKTALWVADNLFEANRNSKKPALRYYILLKDCYGKLEAFDKAVAACQYALQLKPRDLMLEDDLKNFSASMTMQKGNYGSAGDFRDSMKDRDEQNKLHSQTKSIKTEDVRLANLHDAEKKYEQSPDNPGVIFGYADALADMGNDESYRKAIELLEEKYAQTGDFSFNRKAGETRIKQVKRRITNIRLAAEGDSGNMKLKDSLETARRELLAVELEHFRLCSDNYPTDFGMKYEYGVRLMAAGRYDDAIPLMQEARKDPRHRFLAMNKLGLCFFMKQWFADAIDVFRQAIDSYAIQDDGIAKELRYNLARTYEHNGHNAEALELYRKLAQIDYTFRDVRQRVDKLRGCKQ